MELQKFGARPHGNLFRAAFVGGALCLIAACEPTPSGDVDGGVGGNGGGGSSAGGEGGGANEGGAVVGGAGGEHAGGAHEGGSVGGHAGGAHEGGSVGGNAGGAHEGGSVGGNAGGAHEGGSVGGNAGGAHEGGSVGGNAGGAHEGGSVGGHAGGAHEGGSGGGVVEPCPDADQDGICDADDAECNPDGLPALCNRRPPLCEAGTVPEVINQCYTDVCVVWAECHVGVPPAPEPCSRVEPGEFGDCRAIIGFASNGDGTCGIVSGCGCDDRCAGRVFDDEASCVHACVEPPAPAICGGFLGLECAAGFVCIDDPSDECDPAHGGADCMGTCVEQGCRDTDSDGICDADDVACNADGTEIQCRRASPVCERGTVAEVRENCYTGLCVGWDVCGQVIEPPPVACEPIHDGEFGLCDAVIGVGIGADGTCTTISGCGCDERCEGRVFDSERACQLACGGIVDPPVAQCGGFIGAVCEAGFDCIDDPSDDCDPAHGGADCIGLCVPGVPPCSDADADGRCDADDFECNPHGAQAACDRAPPICRAGLVPAVSGACYLEACITWEACAELSAPAQMCGGIAGIPCPRGQACVDDPNDRCDPAHGGADCSGLCVPAL